MGWNGVRRVLQSGGAAGLEVERPRSDTSAPLDATYLAKETVVLKKATNHASLIVQSSVELYRELAVSALSLVRPR